MPFQNSLSVSRHDVDAAGKVNDRKQVYFLSAAGTVLGIFKLDCNRQDQVLSRSSRAVGGPPPASDAARALGCGPVAVTGWGCGVREAVITVT